MLVLNESQVLQDRRHGHLRCPRRKTAPGPCLRARHRHRYPVVEALSVLAPSDPVPADGVFSIQFLQHQHGNPGIIPRQNPLNLRVIPVIILNHRPKIRSPVIPVHQLQLISSRARIPKGPVNYLHCLILCHSVQVNLYKRFIHINSIPVF